MVDFRKFCLTYNPDYAIILYKSTRGGNIMDNTVKWSCSECSAEGTIKYEAPGNPYLVGYKGFKAHSEASLTCRNLNISFDRERLPEAQ